MIPNKELYQNKGLLKSFFSLGRLAIPRKKIKKEEKKEALHILTEAGCPNCGVFEINFKEEMPCPFCNS